MTPNTCNWTLDVLVRCRLSILEARLITAQRINVLAGKNGCGKSQLLAILHSHSNTGPDNYLQEQGYRTYFPADRSQVVISGPSPRIHYVRPSRVIAKHPDERKRGAYGFDDLTNISFSEQYAKFRGILSRLAHDAEHYSSQANEEANRAIRERKRVLLENILAVFRDLFPQLSLDFQVDSVGRSVSLFASHHNMPFVRPEDPRFGSDLRIPFATLSDGELNGLYLLFQVLYHSNASSTPILFLIDEIENHLHPAMQLKAVDHLRAVLPENAMILATTHSPLIITNVPAESRILMVHSSEMYSGGLSNQLLFGREADMARILYELYGAESALAAQHLFRDYHRAASAEVVSYAEECLHHAVAKADSAQTDPQRIFLSSLIQNRIAEHGVLRVLDIGAGPGRMIKGLRQDFAGDSLLNITIDAVEQSVEYRAALSELARDQLGAYLNNVFSDTALIPSGTKYDLILLHNVLHELWCTELISNLIRCCELLDVGGILNVLEMAVLPEGENRFFVFTENSLVGCLNAIGFQAKPPSHRKSHSGIPLYEITAVWRGGDVPTVLKVTTAVGLAVEESIDQTVGAFRDGLGQANPLHLAFYSFNIAFGHLLLSALAGEVSKEQLLIAD